VLVCVCWDKDGILLVDNLENGTTIMAEYSVAFFNNLKQQLVSIHGGRLLKGILFLQDSADPYRAAITNQKLANLYFEVQKHPAHSPDLASSDYCLFPNLRKYLSARKFLSTEEATLAEDRRLAARTEEFFLVGLKKLEQISYKCVELRGECVE
jgi:hypothetical protein